MAGHDNGGAVTELGGQWFQILHAWLMNCQNTKQQKILKKIYILNNELGGQCHELWIVRLDKSKTKYQTTRSLYNYVFMFNFNGMLIPLEKRSTYELGHLSLTCFAWWGHNNVWSQFLLLFEPTCTVNTTFIDIFTILLSCQGWAVSKCFAVCAFRAGRAGPA